MAALMAKALLFFDKLFSRFKLKNIILLESWPTYSDNSRSLFDEMIRQGVNNKYKIYWNIFSHDTDSIKNYNLLKSQLTAYGNVKIINSYTGSFFYDLLQKIVKTYVFNVAKVYIICNHHIEKKRSNQIYINLTHGAPLKCIKNHGYGSPVWSDYIVRLSDIFEENLKEPELNRAQYISLGYPRNDDLLKEKIDLHNIFDDRKFDKVIYWMPTWRQHSLNGKSVTQSSSVPIIHNVEKAAQVNSAAEKNNILIVLKPHFAQDVSKFKEIHLSNIVFITNEFLSEKKILNYELLRSVDALITDYSSVYYDYLLCDKPIGLCWEDFDEFNEKEGFAVDIEKLLSGGEKLYDVNDLCAFIERISDNVDLLSPQRKENVKLAHKYPDNNSSRRVVDFIVNILEDGNCRKNDYV